MKETIEDPVTGVRDDLGIAAEILMEDGNHQAAALLLDVVGFDYQWMEFERYRAVLEVEPWLVDRFTEDVVEAIHTALCEVTRDAGEDFDLTLTTVRRRLPSPTDWRKSVERILAGDVTNHATLFPVPLKHPEADGLHFRSESERTLYEALKSRQSPVGSRNSIAILPNAAIRIPGHTWEVDFLICCNGRAGVIEIDGDHHRGKRSSDRSRDHLLEDAGIAYVDRIDADDALDSERSQVFVSRFLDRLRP